ncbi:hypothetical protein EDB81DRAFT_866591 [Dactylonectria macrodidyma]|uniref:Uncharacterized protein n=1 Tax=Dactylonectria macrodidyma TaxID=307937 RepID=A0A9P9FEQ8_9HYPO|nr:hypothetical protein EDB81DRAFT_866591 [Dactylonectria macrodidyma]
MTTLTTVLITGGNRAIGKGFVQTFLSRPATTVVVAVRNPEHATSKSLHELPKGEGSLLILAKLDSNITSDAGEHGIQALDIVIANAGIASKSGNPIFVAISTLIGSIGSMEALAGFPPTQSPYGGSKAALNWFIRRLHFEEPWLASFVFHPGLVETDLAAGAVASGGSSLTLADLGAISVNTSVEGMVRVIDAATREVSGTFKVYDGTGVPW